MAVNKWIQRAVQRPGRIKRALGVSPNEPIPASKVGRLKAMAKKTGKKGSKAYSLASAARLALRFKKGI